MQLLNLSELGLGSAIIFRLYKPLSNNNIEECRKYLNFLKNAYLVIGCLIVALGLIFSFFISSLTYDVKIDSGEIYLIFWLYVIQMASSYWVLSFRHAIIQADQKGYIVTAFSTLGILIGSLGQIAFYIVFHSYIAGIIFTLACQTLMGFITSVYAKQKYPYLAKISKSVKLSKYEAKSLAKDIFALSFTKLCKASNKSVPTVVVSASAGAIQAGIFSNYQMIMNSIDSLLTVAFSSLTASIGNLNALADDKAKIDTFEKLNFIMFIILSVCSACCLTLINPFIELVWGQEYLLSQWVVIAISAYITISGFLLIISDFKEAGGIFWQGRYRPLIGCVLNILLAVIFMKEFGIAGVIWTTTVSRVLTESWFDPLLVCKHILHTSPKNYFLRLIGYIFLIICTSGISGLLCSVLPFNGILGLLFCALISIIVPVILILITFHRSSNCKFVLDLSKKLLKVAKRKSVI